MTPSVAVTRTPLPDLHAAFAAALPAVEARAGRAFRAVRCPHAREDAVADVVLAAWKKFLRSATERVAVDPADLARRAVAAVARRLHRQTLLPA
ncbi:MAG: hypothetical protein JWO38_8137 [Gemmataceae bacterium]|nr:hypothetical protein [Gemmataceae bacterium]